MVRRQLAIVFLFSTVISATAYAQAVIEYGAAAAKSAAAKPPLGSAAAATGKKLSDSLDGGNTSSSEPVRATGTVSQGEPLETAMRANRRKLEPKLGKTPATLRIGSVPNRTVVAIDGLPMDYAPGELRLPPGKHVVELTHPAFLPYRHEVVLAPSEELALDPKLEKRDRRFVFISFD